MANLIFDFDGTIADSFEYVLDYLAREIQGEDSRVRQHHGEYRGLSMRQMATQLGAKPWHLPFLFFRGRKQMGRALARIKTFEDLPEVLAQLHNDGHRLFLVSVNLRQNIMPFLKAHGIEEYFDDVVGSASVFGKAPTLRRLLVQHRLKPDDCWYIGDEAHDTVAAHKTGIKAASVTWGYNNLKRLKQADPEALIFSVGEILKLPG